MAGGRRNDGRGGLPEGRDIGSDLLSMAQQIWRVDAVGDEVTEASRGGEFPVEASGGQSQSGQGDATGCYPPKAVRLGRAREIVGYLQASYKVSE